MTPGIRGHASSSGNVVRIALGLGSWRFVYLEKLTLALQRLDNVSAMVWWVRAAAGLNRNGHRHTLTPGIRAV